MKKYWILVLAVFFIFSWSCATAPSTSTPSPAANRLAQLKNIEHAGNWSDGPEASLIIKEVSDNKARVQYTWGDYPRYTIRAGSQIYDAPIVGSGEKPEFYFAIFRFRVLPDGTIKGAMLKGSQANEILMRRK